MKKAPILMLICLLLCGCDAGDNGITNVSSLTPPTERPADLRGLSVSTDYPEPEAFDTVSAFPLQQEHIYGIRTAANQVLVFCGEENTTLTRLAGEDLSEAESYALDGWLSHLDTSLQIKDGVISFHLPHRRETVVLNDHLQELKRIPDPAVLSGSPVFDAQNNTLYYCTDNAIFAWDIRENIHRTLKELSYSHQELAGIFLEGTVLQCRIMDGNREEQLFLSTENGKLLHTHSGNLLLKDDNGKYYAQFPNGAAQSLVFGSDPNSPQALIPPQSDIRCTFLNRQHRAVIHTFSDEGMPVLRIYDLNSGCCAASLVLSPQTQLLAIDGSADGLVYLLCKDSQSGQSTIYQWDCSAPTLQENTSCIQTHYTHKSPDLEGLDDCRTYADRLGKQYGIRILIGKDAARIQPSDYHLEAEHLVSVLMDGLHMLERCLALFPPDMLQDTASHFSSLSVCLVRQVSGSVRSGNPEAVEGIQFLDGTDAYIALALGENAEAALYHELFHVMDTHLLGNTGALDRWNELNPAGFSYDYSYEANRTRNSGVYLQHSSRAFVDTYSMSYPKEDKARIMEYAMLPGNRELFSNPTLQRKLKALCDGLRDAYGLENKQEVYRWEQYLE